MAHFESATGESREGLKLPTPSGRVTVHLEISHRRAYAFIPHPTERARWLRVHPCVATVECLECKAWAGEPCKDLRQPGNYLTTEEGCHFERRQAYKNTWENLSPMTFVRMVHADFETKE